MPEGILCISSANALVLVNLIPEFQRKRTDTFTEVSAAQTQIFRRSPFPNTAGTLVGVLARLCSHLREMAGLSIRATVSQLDYSAPAVDVFTYPGSLHIARLPLSSPVTTTASQPPIVANGI